MENTAVEDIIYQFRLNGRVTTRAPFGNGHINDTYRIGTDTGQHYLLQKINHYVFRDVPALMSNVVNVIRHLKEKLRATPGRDPEKQVLTLVETIDNDYYLKDSFGNYWRVFLFLNNTKSYDQALTETQAFEAGTAFGSFQALLSDIDTALIVDTIPNFHHIEYRLHNLDKAVKADTAKRLNNVLPEIEFINERRASMGKVLQMGNAGIIPKRIIHNDTKFNNVLLDEHDHAQCVIDLDTVMPGYVAYDFGDAIRTTINTAPEDEADLSLIKLKISLFAAFTNGYLQQATRFLAEAEIASLMEGVLLLPYMQGIRFLTDYLNGDVYFKIHSPSHNLQRARAQFQLVKKLEGEKETLNDIILQTWKKYKTNS